MTYQRGRDSTYIFKVLLIGEAAVGKTSLTIKFVHGKFKSDYLLTVGMEPYSKYIKMGNDMVTLSIWDILDNKDSMFFARCFSGEPKQRSWYLISQDPLH